MGSKQPVILLSWAIPGNVYPVIENHNGPASLLGTALKSGMTSLLRIICEFIQCVMNEG